MLEFLLKAETDEKGVTQHGRRGIFKAYLIIIYITRKSTKRDQQIKKKE